MNQSSKQILLSLEEYNRDLDQHRAEGMHQIKAAMLIELRKANKAFDEHVAALEVVQALDVPVVPMINKSVDYVGNMIVEFFRDKVETSPQEIATKE